jgi:hypothetical protein
MPLLSAGWIRAWLDVPLAEVERFPATVDHRMH